jgi:glycosyltransferase involved in cell wall biosynthesis
LSKIKISLDARPLSTPVSGVGRLIAETIFHFPDKDKYEFILHSHFPIHKNHYKILDLPNVSSRIGKGILAKKGGAYFLFYLPFEIRNEMPDLFWGSQQVIPIGLPRDLPIVLTFCDLVLYLYPETMRKIAAIQQRFFQSYSVKHADFILSISNSTREDLLKNFDYPNYKTGVAFPGVSTSGILDLLKDYSTDTPPNLPNSFLLSVSTIEPRKNYSFLLNTFKEYRKLAGSSKLPWVIVGKIGWEDPSFIEMLEKEILEYKDIIIIKNCQDSLLHYLYSKCEIFLFASLYEGFGIPLLEALAHRKKCLVSDIPTFREIGGESIPYLKTVSPTEWAKKIIKLQASDVTPMIDLEKFSWERSAMETEKAFQSVLKK